MVENKDKILIEMKENLHYTFENSILNRFCSKISDARSRACTLLSIYVHLIAKQWIISIQELELINVTRMDPFHLRIEKCWAKMSIWWWGWAIRLNCVIRIDIEYIHGVQHFHFFTKWEFLQMRERYWEIAMIRIVWNRNVSCSELFGIETS